VPELSDDRRYATAYNASLQLAKMALACAGYRVAGIAHHRTTFEVLQLAMGPKMQPLAWYFDACRRRWNVIECDHAYITTEVETAELLRNLREFQSDIEAWINDNYPSLAAGKDLEAGNADAG